MRLLLDTHAFLWFIGGDSRLSQNARSAIEDDENQLFLSSASAWEMAIKSAIGKLPLNLPLTQFVGQACERNLIELIPINPAHMELTIGLPLHHRDPFDRMLVAQASIEGLNLVSIDATLDAYGIGRLW